MKKIIIKLLFLVCSSLASVVILAFVSPEDKLSYYSAMHKKLARLEQLASKKIILVGGSNFTFGIDSKHVEDEFNFKVVNMSLHAGLGFDFMLRQIINNLEKGVIFDGDVVVISPEYSHFLKNKNYGDGNTIYGYILDNRNFNDFSYFTILYNINHIGKSIYNQYEQIIRNDHGLYSSSNFNEFGDMIGHLCLPNKKFSHLIKNDDCDIDIIQFDKIDNFINKMNNFGVKTYITFPSISLTGYDNRKICNEKIALTLKSKFNYNMISDNKKYVFNDDLFFDTDYHLNNVGRNMRTDYLISDLHRVIIAPHQ